MAWPDLRVYVDLAAGALEDADTWIDITDYVDELSVEWGRKSLVEQFIPGTGYFRARNEDGRFDPLNTSGPYYPGLKPRRRFKAEVPVADTVLFTDTFSDGTVHASWSLTNPGSISESVDQLHIAATAGVGTAAAARPAQDLTDCEIVLDLFSVQSVSPFNGIALPLEVVMGGSDVVGWMVTRPELGGPTYISTYIDRSGIDGALTNDLGLVLEEYNTTDWRYLRIKFHRGKTYFSQSADGFNWTDRMVIDVAWPNLDNAIVRSYVQRTGASGTMQLNLANFEIRNKLVHPVAYGWTGGWPVHQDGRAESTVNVEWNDALTTLSRIYLEESVWDWAVRDYGPVAWYRLDGETSTATDYSGNGYTAYFRTFQGTGSPWGGELTPDSIVEQGDAPSLVPATDRPGKSWAKMQHEIGQDLGGVTGAPRSPALVLPTEVTQHIQDGSFTVEMWVQARQAFPLDARNIAASTSPIRQPLITFGQPGGLWYEVGISTIGNFYIGASDQTNQWGDATSGPSVIDGQSHHEVFSFQPSGGGTLCTHYHNGIPMGTIALTGSAVPLGGNPVVNFAQPTTSPGGMRQLQSTISDLVIYDHGTVQADAIFRHDAGRYGYLRQAPGDIGSSGRYPQEMAQQTLQMIGWEINNHIQPELFYQPLAGFETWPGPLKRRTALEYLRQLSNSERAPFYQAPDGALEWLPRTWQSQLSRATDVQYTYGDRAGDAYGYTDLNFNIDEETICNQVTVKYYGGELTVSNPDSVLEYGPMSEDLDTLLIEPEQASQVGYWHMNSRREPRLLLTRPMLIEPVTDEEFEAVLRLDFATRLELVRTTADGREIGGEYWVQAIKHVIGGGRTTWQTYVTLEPADIPGTLFRFDVGHFNGPEVFAL